MPPAVHPAAHPVVHRVPAFADNYIWLYEYRPGTVAVVDPGDAKPVLAAVAAKGLAVSHILNTHWHGDHTGGNLALKEATGCAILGPARERAKIPGLDRPLDDGDEILLGQEDGPERGEVRGEVLFVGAHTMGHIAYHFAAAKLLFPGDTLFAMGCGRLFEGDADDLFAALAKLQRLPADTRVFCAHEYTLGNARFALTVEPENAALQARYAKVQELRARERPTVPFTLGEELDTNPFLRSRNAAELGKLRRAKDAF